MDRHIDFNDCQFSLLEAADHLRISRSFVYKLINQDRLRPTKIGARTVFSGAELSRFLATTQDPQK